jgi:threonyl-tRNA synthetase
LPVSEKHNEYAQHVVKTLKKHEIRAEVDDRNEKVGRKIRDNELKRIPYLLVVGEKEAENEEVSVRKQGGIDLGSINLLTFAQNVTQEVKEMMNREQTN